MGHCSPWRTYIQRTPDSWYEIPFNHTQPAIVSEPRIVPHLRAKLDTRLLSMILDRKANWNNAEIGSHLTLLTSDGGGKIPYEPMVFYLLPYFQGDVVPAAVTA